MKRLLTVSLLAVFPLLSAPEDARALPCPGASVFDDVPAAADFCTDALWARNAQITIGCGGNNFCPNEPVIRAQMVLFLHRMALATFTTAVLAESSDAPSGDLDGAGVSACPTTTIAAGQPNGHTVHAIADVSLLGGASAAEVQLGVSRSAGGGPFVSATAVSSIVSVPPGQWVTASVMGGVVPLSVAAPHQWRIDLSRAPGSATTGELAGLRCHIKVFRSLDPVASP